MKIIDDSAMGLCINLPKNLFVDGAIENARQIVATYEKDLKRILSTDNLDIIEEDDEVLFSWFDYPEADEEHDAYLRLVHSICNAANAQRNLSKAIESIDNMLQVQVED